MLIMHLHTGNHTAKLHFRSGGTAQAENLYCCKKKNTNRHTLVKLNVAHGRVDERLFVCGRVVHLGFLVLNRQVEFKLCWELILSVQSV